MAWSDAARAAAAEMRKRKAAGQDWRMRPKKGAGYAGMKKELGKLLLKRDKIREKQMARYKNHSATRARTTTGNADADRVNDSIMEMRERMRHYSRVVAK